MNKVCPCCGQTLPDAFPDGVHLSPIKRRIVERVRRAGKNGILTDDLFDFVYADDPDGGPLSGKICLQAHVWQINRRLRVIGKVIRAPKGGNRRATSYVLKDL